MAVRSNGNLDYKFNVTIRDKDGKTYTKLMAGSGKNYEEAVSSLRKNVHFNHELVDYTPTSARLHAPTQYHPGGKVVGTAWTNFANEDEAKGYTGGLGVQSFASTKESEKAGLTTPDDLFQGTSRLSRSPGESIGDFTNRIDTNLFLRPGETFEQYEARASAYQGIKNPLLNSPASSESSYGGGVGGYSRTSPQPSVGTSTALRMKERAAALKDAFGLGNAPVMPDLFGSQDQKSLNLARQERDAINKEMESILSERLAIDAEFRKFKQNAGAGVTETGRAGVTSEEGRKVQEQYDALNRRELVLETKLNNRNSVISELMQNQKQDYANAVTEYNNRFSQALQLYQLFDKEDDELQANAKANLEVLSSSIQAQIEAGTLSPEKITSVQRSQISDLETQAGLPQGSTLAILQTLKPNEEKLWAGVDDFGGFSYITKNAKGEIKVYKSANAVPQDTSETDGEDSKIVTKFNADLATPNLLKTAGTREQFIRQLQAKYPEIDPSDIATAVYSTYPDGYEKMFSTGRAL